MPIVIIASMMRIPVSCACNYASVSRHEEYLNSLQGPSTAKMLSTLLQRVHYGACLHVKAHCTYCSANQYEHCCFGAGQPVNLVKLTDYMDTCVVGWSSVNSCIAKGINGTTCALMPFFDDVATVPYQCPFKNETQVCTHCLACAKNLYTP